MYVSNNNTEDKGCNKNRSVFNELPNTNEQIKILMVDGYGNLTVCGPIVFAFFISLRLASRALSVKINKDGGCS